MLLQSQGKLEAAEPLSREALAGLRGALGPAHPNTVACTKNLAHLLTARGKHREAAALLPTK